LSIVWGRDRACIERRMSCDRACGSERGKLAGSMRRVKAA
jgi:hypothetical protein